MEAEKLTICPVECIDLVLKWVQKSCDRLPLFHSAVAAGFPSPAEDAIDQELDLNELLVKHPAATFFLRVSGDSMVNAGIHDRDILVVDRSLSPAHGKIVIASLDGELTVKRLHHGKQGTFLLPENEAYRPIKVTEGADFRIWGVVTHVIHAV